MIDTRNIKIKKLVKEAIIPQYQTEGSAGFDFHSLIYTVVLPGTQELIPTGIAIELPEGTELQLRARSGLAVKYMITVTNSPGTIDSDYRGEIKIILINHSKVPFVVNVKDRIAQGVFKEYLRANFIEVDELSNSSRGEGGYGHTGV